MYTLYVQFTSVVLCMVVSRTSAVSQTLSAGLKSMSSDVATSSNTIDEDSMNLSEELAWTFDHLPHHRAKRFLFMTDEKRIVLPPGTQLVLTPTLALPFLRYPPDGVDANMTISTPFTIGFDAMGVTDNQNPFGLLPFLNPALGGALFGRKKRSIPDPDIPPHKITGGERAFLYEWVEDYLFTFGMDGKACILRAICETHEAPLIGYGIMGEFLHVFLSPSKSPYWNRLKEYIAAERTGRETGDCSHYSAPCSKSLYKLNKYSKQAQTETKSKVHKTLNLKEFLPLGNQLLNDIM